MNRTLTLGYSPCPNDTFIFYALAHHRIPLGDGLTFAVQLEDVETLNQLALQGSLDLTKVSYHALGHLRDRYALLRSGGALGRGCGPLVVAPDNTSMDRLRHRKIAVPGHLTTANLLLQLFGSGYENLLILPFDRIVSAVSNGSAAAGVIIHESRFTYQQSGLHQVLDLGEWWEQETGLPIPLGGILARRDLGPAIVRKVDQAVRTSLEFARQNPEETRRYIKRHAQELDDAVIDAHIALYVNDFSLDLGEEGLQAIQTLFQRAEERGLISRSTAPLLLS